MTSLPPRTFLYQFKLCSTSLALCSKLPTSSLWPEKPTTIFTYYPMLLR